MKAHKLCTATLALVTALAALCPRVLTAQYMYIDTNGDGIHSAADVITPGTVNHFAVYLDTTHDRNGSTQSCNSHTGQPYSPGAVLDMTSYDLILQVSDGSVGWGTWIDEVGFGVLGTDQSNGGELLISRAGSTKVPGLWKLGHVDGVPSAGTSLVRIGIYSTIDPLATTDFGTSCDASNYPNAYVLGTDWFDTDIAGAIKSWKPDGIKVAAVPASYQKYPAILSDGSGGAFVTWSDERAGPVLNDIYAQRLGPGGKLLWNVNGVPVCTAASEQQVPRLTGDGADGAIVTWYDRRTVNKWEVYAQRINPSGSPLWQTNGVLLRSSAAHQQDPRPVSNGGGGAIITWWESGVGPTNRIYAQAIDGFGSIQWGSNGAVLDTLGGSLPQITADGVGGAFIAWSRGGVRVQHLDALGSKQWAADGLVLSSTGSDPSLVSDGNSGVIVTWADNRKGLPLDSMDVYAQRVDASGAPMWTAGGAAVDKSMGGQLSPRLAADGTGGAFIFFQSHPSTWDVIARHILSTGSLAMPDSIPICTASGDQQLTPYFDSVIADGDSGAIVVWEDTRSGNTDIYAQRLDKTGHVSWQANGVPLVSQPLDQYYPTVCPDAFGGAVVAWLDQRDGIDTYVYATRVSHNGFTFLTAVDSNGGQAAPSVVLHQNRPNPFNPTTTIDYYLSSRSKVSLRIFDTQGRLVTTLADGVAGEGSHSIRWDGRDLKGKPVSSGIYFYRLDTGNKVESQRMVLLK